MKGTSTLKLSNMLDAQRKGCGDKPQPFLTDTYEYFLLTFAYSDLRARSQETNPAPMLASRIAPGAGIGLVGGGTG